jgi:hypothetical protein
MSKEDEEMLRKAEALDQSDDPQEQLGAMEQGKVRGRTFDMQIIELFRPYVIEAFQKHGDMLRSVGIFFDYYGSLNEAAGVQKGMWMGPEGPVQTPDGVIGSLQGSLILVQEILGRAAEMEGNARENLTVLLTEIQKRSEEYDELEAKIREAKKQLGEEDKEEGPEGGASQGGA